MQYTRGEPKDFNGLGGKKSLAAEWDRGIADRDGGASMPTASELSQRRRSTAFRCQWTNPLARTSAPSHVIPQFPCVSRSCAAKNTRSVCENRRAHAGSAGDIPIHVFAQTQLDLRAVD